MQLRPEHIEEALYGAIKQLACNLSSDVCSQLEDAQAAESNTLACEVLRELLENQRIARTDGVPICQDTGTVWVCLEVGPDILLSGDVFSRVDTAVERAYKDFALRKSVVRDAYCNRANTGTNAPAFTEVHFVDEPGACKLHVMLKGGGSDNASQVIMMNPSATDDDIVAAVVARVREKGANACPPLVIGVDIGATFDKVAGLSKMALMRPVGQAAAEPKAAALEAAILQAVNETGIGPGGVGGNTTALAVHVQTAPCHIAALPVAINLCCCALRRMTIDLAGEKGASGADTSLAGFAPDSQNPSSTCGTRASRSDSPRSRSTDFPNLLRKARSASALEAPVRLTLPLQKDQLAKLHAGDRVLLSGDMYCLRDAGHMRLMQELQEQGILPYDLAGQAIFYAGPTPEAAGRPFGAVGPTTASRMDFAAPALYDAGIVATIGKGKRSAAVKEACQRNGAVYFGSVGGAAAFLAKCVEDAQTISYDELGTEALRRITVTDFPAFVAIDTFGNELYA